MKERKCFVCFQPGHRAADCPNKPRSDVRAARTEERESPQMDRVAEIKRLTRDIGQYDRQRLQEYIDTSDFAEGED